MPEMHPQNPVRKNFRVLGLIRKTNDRYYYDVEIDGERKILSVGQAVFETIQANRATDKFLLEKDGMITRCRPA